MTLSRGATVLLVLTSFAPVLLTVAFTAWLEDGGSAVVLGSLLAAIALVLAALALIIISSICLEVHSIRISSIKSVDREIIGFVIAYLLPLASKGTKLTLDWRVAVFVAFIFCVVVWSTHSYHFNPLLGMLGYHFFEIATDAGVTYVLLTRRDLRNSKTVTSVVQIGDYVLLEAWRPKP